MWTTRRKQHLIQGCLLAALVLSRAVRIQNYERGEHNAEHDVHDGTISKWTDDGPYYSYRMAYSQCKMNSGWLRPVYVAINWFVSTFAPGVSTCNGFNCAPIAFHRFGEDCGFLTAAQGQTVKVHYSWDLVTWTEAHSPALDVNHPLLQEAILFRPAVIHCRRTQKYVLWVNRIPIGYSVWDGYTRGGYLVAQADAPTGPFEILSRQPTLEFGGGGDFSLLADGDHAWIAYGSWDNGYKTEGIHAFLPAELNAGHRIAVQPLTADFTDAASGVAANTVSPPDQEAPTLFKYSDLYYLLYGDLCCFCPQGSDVKVLVASHPMGNWTHVGWLNPYGREHIRAQSNSVIEVSLANGSSALIWTADLWQSSRSGFKGDDVQFWAPLEFGIKQDIEMDVAQSGEPRSKLRSVSVPSPIKWVDSFDLHIAQPFPESALSDECELS